MVFDHLSLAWLYVWSAIFGAVLGSFGNVLIWRLPRDLSIVRPGSHCPQCNKAIQFYDNIPIISYLVLGGRCRYCHAKISIRYPLVELASALLFLSSAVAFGWTLATLFYGLFLVALLVLTIIDIEHWLLPFAIMIPMTVIGVIGAAIQATLPFGQAFIGSALGLFFFFGIMYVGKWVLKRDAMGGGDVVFGMMAGMYLGAPRTIVMIFLASFLGALVSIPLLLLKRKQGKDPIPFGPFLSVAAALALFFGEAIIKWYIGFIW